MRISDWSSDVCSSDLEAVAPSDPDENRDRRDAEHLAQHRQHVLGPDEAAIEEGETRQDHGEHQDRRGEHPGGVALDRESVVEGKRVSVRVDLGGRRIIQNINNIKTEKSTVKTK